MKSGFRRILISGTAMTTWEANEELDGRLCSVLSTELKFEGPVGSGLFHPRPTKFSGKTVYHFDQDQGRAVLGVVETELEQTIWVSRLKENFRMTMKLAE